MHTETPKKPDPGAQCVTKSRGLCSNAVCRSRSCRGAEDQCRLIGGAQGDGGLPAGRCRAWQWWQRSCWPIWQSSCRRELGLCAQTCRRLEIETGERGGTRRREAGWGAGGSLWTKSCRVSCWSGTGDVLTKLVAVGVSGGV